MNKLRLLLGMQILESKKNGKQLLNIYCYKYTYFDPTNILMKSAS